MGIDEHDQCRPARGRIDRRRFLEVAGAGTVATTLAGCLDESSETNGDSNGDDDGTDDADEEPTALDGTFKIGHLAPLENHHGVGSARSAELAAAEINADGGVLGASVEVHSVDTRAQPSVAKDETKRLITQENADLLVGTFVDEVSLAVIDLLAEHDVPYIVTGAASPELIERSTGSDYESYRNVFRTGPINSVFQAEAMADYADALDEQHGWNSFAFLAEDSRWATPFTEVLPDELRDRGYDIDYEAVLPTDTNDFTPYVDDLADADPDAVFRFFGHVVGVPLLSAWHQRQLEFGIEGIHIASAMPAFYDLSGGAAAYETTAQAGAAGTASLTSRTLPFVEEYRSGLEDNSNAPALPMEMGFNTYDAIRFYRRAVESAGTADYENHLDEIVDALLGLEYTGTAGEISLHDEGSPYPHDVRPTRNTDGRITNYPVTQWQSDGDLECVYPRSVATADHLAPDWM